nr:MAG TPA: Ig epsilon chain C region FOLD LECTIN, ANTIBODY RECEPTOR [Caudoviricetes sp.]
MIFLYLKKKPGVDFLKNHLQGGCVWIGLSYSSG